MSICSLIVKINFRFCYTIIILETDKMKHTIYLVEDDKDIREVVEYLLTGIGLNIQSYGTISAFRKQLELALPDMMILDIMLPDGNGIDVCHELKSAELTREIPVLLMSAHADGKSPDGKLYADDFISKPFDVEDFIHRIEQMLQAISLNQSTSGMS